MREVLPWRDFFYLAFLNLLTNFEKYILQVTTLVAN